MSDSEKAAPGLLGNSAKPDKIRRAVFYVPNCATLRVNKGKQIAELAKAAGVNQDTIEKIEKLIGVTEVFARKIFNVLDEWHPALHLKADVEITTTPRKIQNPLTPSAQKKNAP